MAKVRAVEWPLSEDIIYAYMALSKPYRDKLCKYLVHITGNIFLFHDDYFICLSPHEGRFHFGRQGVNRSVFFKSLEEAIDFVDRDGKLPAPLEEEWVK